MAALETVKVTWRGSLPVIDNDDPDDEPQVVYADGGEIIIEPLQGGVKVLDGEPVPFEMLKASFTCIIDGEGYLSWQGRKYVRVPDYTSSRLTPSIPDGKATHSVKFRNVTINGNAVTIEQRNVRLAADTVGADGVCDLVRLLPVPVASSVPIVIGPRGPAGPNSIPTSEFMGTELSTTGTPAEQALAAKVAALIAAGVPTLIAEQIASLDISDQVLAAIAADGTVSGAAAAAVTTALVDASVTTGEADDTGEFAVRFYDGEPIIQANEEQGIHDTKIAGSDFLTGDGWIFRIAVKNEATGRIYTQLGQRDDGTYYPPGIGGTAATVAPVVIPGTSLAANWGSSVAGLATLLGRTVVAQGDGGQKSMYVAARQGGEPFRVTVTGGEIPASGSIATTAAFVPVATNATVASMPASSLTGTLAGVAGTLTFGTDGVGTFTRTSPGIATKVSTGTPFITGAARRAHWPIIWAMRNNFKAAGDVVQGVRDVRRMLDYYTADAREHALILSEPPWPGEYPGGEYASIRAYLDQMNNALRDAFPTMFVDTAAMLRSTAMLTAVGVTPTAEDLEAIAQDVTPLSFRAGTSDGHINAKGYEALNLIISNIYKARGWAA